MMDHSPPIRNKVEPLQRWQIMLGLLLLGYGLFLGGIYSSIHFHLWLATHFLVIALVILGLLWPAWRRNAWPATVLDGPLLALGLSMALSALFSAWPRLALEGIFPWLSQVLVFYLVIRLMRSGWADSLLRALMLATGLVILVGLVEMMAWYFGLPLLPQFSRGWWDIGGLANPLPPVWHRLSFTLANAVVLSAYLVLVIPLGITFSFTTPRPADRSLVGLFVLASLVVLGFTFSRGGLLGLGASLGSLGGLWLWRHYHRFSAIQRRILAIALGLSGGGGLGLIFYLIARLWDPTRATGDAARIGLWQAALQLYQQRPIWGVGPGLLRWEWRLSPFRAHIPDRSVTAHSLYLNHLAELGTVGGLVGLWLLVVAGIAVWYVLQNTTDNRLWWRRAGCVAGLIGFLVQGLFETFTTWPLALPVIILAAYLVAPLGSAGNFSGRRFISLAIRNRPHWSRMAALTLPSLWLVAALFATYLAWPRALAEQARKATAIHQNQTALRLLRQSIKLDPDFTLYQFEAAAELARLDPPNYPAAHTMYQTALHREPSYGLNHANLALIEWALGDREAALGQITIATQLAAEIPQFWLTRGTYAEIMAYYEQAHVAYTQALVKNPAWANSDFWQATSWRKDNFPALLEAAFATLPPLKQAEARFNYYLRTANLAAAEAALADLDRLDAGGYHYHLAAAQLNLAQENLSLALDQVRKASQLQPHRSEPYALQAEILLNLGQLEPAQQALDFALFLDPVSGRAYYVLGRLYEAQGRDAEAQAAYQRGYSPPAFSLDYTVAIYRQLAALLPLPGLQSISGGPHEVRAWFALADLQKKQGRFQQATQIYKLLLDEDPFLRQARVEMEELCQKNKAWCDGP